jgi:hypothetical protein
MDSRLSRTSHFENFKIYIKIHARDAGCPGNADALAEIINVIVVPSVRIQVTGLGIHAMFY